LVPAFDQMIHSGRPLVVNDAARSTLLPVSLVRALGMRAAMVVPLRGRRRQTIGVLLLDQSEEDVGFTDQHVTTMSGMARHLSMMLENAILFDEIRTASESMAVINEIAIQLAMLTDEESLFRQLHYQLASVLDASHLAMGLLTPNRRALDVRFAVESNVVPGTQRTPLGDDPLSLTALSGRVELIGTRPGGDHLAWHPGDYEADPAHSPLTVPIAVGRNVIGALMVRSAFRNAYGPRDVDLLTSVALHAGIAIENARLYRLVQSRGDRRAVVLDDVINRHEAERKELVDDIHDDTLQVLASCLYRLDRVYQAVEQPGQQDLALAQLDAVRDSIAENVTRLRKRIFTLRPATLDRLGLEPSLRELVGGFGRDRGIDVELDVELPGRLTAEHEMVAYRVVQEALAHIVARGGASRLRVRLRQRAGAVSITIHDDGGLERADGPLPSSEDDRSDITLLALIERAELAGGHMRVAHRAGGGSLMQITVPGTIRAELDEDAFDDAGDWKAAVLDAPHNGNEEHRAGS
jgi:signal transduction histidine kinase